MMVAGGTAGAQVIMMAFAPLITRLYGPESYGVQGVFLSVLNILATVAALGYPTAVVLPSGDADALRIAKITAWCGAIISLLFALLLVSFSGDLFSLVKAEVLSDFVLLLPIATFISVLSAIQAQWLIRKRAFALTARFAVFTSLMVNGGKAAVGYISPTAMALIVVNVIGSGLGLLLTYFGCRKGAAFDHSEAGPSAASSVNELLKRYSDFPLYRMPQNLINVLSQSMPLLLLSIIFGAGPAGQYSIAFSVLGVPSALIGGAVLSVFYPRVNEALRAGENAQRLIVRSTLGMAISGLVPFGSVVLLGPYLFELVFGSDWRVAGLFAQWLAVLVFFQYINRPAIAAIPVLGIQKQFLFYEIASAAAKAIALIVGFYLYRNPLIAIAFFAVAGALAYIWLIVWVVRSSGLNAMRRD
ncbi:lipopolysaccharide biosynthesis protein [Thauera sp. 2A1]|uniref:lipopolysaccharide biosynthesis protein n=1 Tax=Thauera sp. 2A1 TaxID=2570191 RepID=UPI0034D51D6F